MPWSIRGCGLSSVAEPLIVGTSWPAAAMRLVGPVFHRLLHNRSFVLGVSLVLFVALIAVFAGVLAPYDPLRSNFRVRLSPPSAEHWFGTDHFGRDILTRVLYG